MATRDFFVRTEPTRYKAAAALTAGRLVGIDGSGTISYAQTDATAVAAIGVLAETVAAGEYCSIYTEGSVVNVTLNANTAANVKLATGVAANSGKLITAATAGTEYFAITTESGTAGNNVLARIVNAELGA